MYMYSFYSNTMVTKNKAKTYTNIKNEPVKYSCSVKECAELVKQVQNEQTQEVTTSRDHNIKVLVNFINIL